MGVRVEAEAELVRLRARVAQLEGESAAARRLGALSSAIVGTSAAGGAAVAVVTEVVDGEAGLALAAETGFLSGAEVGLDAAGTALYERAKTLIPQGCGLISKRAETFLPDQWPAYYDRAQGPFVWDLSGNKYIDLINCIGMCALGPADPDVNAAVVEAVGRGSFSTLLAPEEVELAEVLVGLHPWCAGGMARFARGGGEINMLAARIARAATQRDRIAVCGCE